MARPLKPINWDVVIKRLQAGNTAKEIAYVLEIFDMDTFYRRFKDEFGISFGDYPVRDMRMCGKANVSYKQYEKALDGNVEMLKLLGKEWNGQGVETLPTKVPNDENIELTGKNMQLQHQLALLKDENERLKNGNQPQTGQKL